MKWAEWSELWSSACVALLGQSGTKWDISSIITTLSQKTLHCLIRGRLTPTLSLHLTPNCRTKPLPWPQTFCNWYSEEAAPSLSWFGIKIFLDYLHFIVHSIHLFLWILFFCLSSNKAHYNLFEINILGSNWYIILMCLFKKLFWMNALWLHDLLYNFIFPIKYTLLNG